MLPILFEDEHFIAINKPNGLLVHRSNIAADVQEFAMQKLRDQVGYKVFLAHRIDRPTSGTLMFGKTSEAAAMLANLFFEKTIQKSYLAVVRGHAPEYGRIDAPLSKENTGAEQEAVTLYTRIGTVELDIPVHPYPTSRYSLIDAQPMTGRMHQIRRHLAKIRHYIIGDKTHGETHHTKMFSEKLDCNKMLLHAHKLNFTHPVTKKEIEIVAPLPEHFLKIIDRFGWDKQ
jgi:tRNA pseudouridine65 synthase